ncbi:30S ribosomal protein S19e [Candidatus Woesearchaeota archaeon]|nr:30S ribosomal protein S19e [Candidatus Woesearchaeota archaeon]
MKVQEQIIKTSEELKKFEEIKAPEWAKFVKTSTNRARPPVEEDWWYIRAASILKKAERLGPIGVNKLRMKYGGKKRRGHKPARFAKASGNLLRKLLQQLEKAGLLKQQAKGTHKGRMITPKGKSLLSKISQNGHRGNKKEETRKVETTISTATK